MQSRRDENELFFLHTGTAAQVIKNRQRISQTLHGAETIHSIMLKT